MKHLSQGWGAGTGLGFLLMWTVSFANFLVLVHNLTLEAAGYEDVLRNGEPYNPTKHAISCFGMALAPLLLSADVAHVSSMCDELLNKINELRMTWSSTEEAQLIHNRVFPLQTTLERMNNNQGLGFVVFTKVVDKKTLNCAPTAPTEAVYPCSNLLQSIVASSCCSCSTNKRRSTLYAVIFLTMVSFFSTAIPLLVAFLPDPNFVDSSGTVHSHHLPVVVF